MEAAPKTPKTPPYPDPKVRAPRIRRPTRAEIRWAAGFWLEVYSETLALLLDSDMNTPRAIAQTETARAVADKALADMQERWPGVWV